MARIWLVLGSLAGFLAVALSAYAAHGLAARPDAARLAVANALDMQGWHALALLAVGLLADRRTGLVVHLAGGAFAIGLVLFCGAVWWGALVGVSLGPVAPIGGTLLMVGWLLLALAAATK
ncbi:DUF423 domain-containing protein [Humitalea sp. 24SJ18S-53]|uniref:DUF423 domain-containing protein n=1 Tax=Humitalea sp. 24SJ18S-53 TaxID=3422307 RepID=UPI003D677FD0